MLKTLTITAAMVLTSFLTFSQDFKSQFKDFTSKKDTAGQAKVLKRWSAKAPNDPELFISYFNYYIGRSTLEVVSLDKDRKDENSLVITDSAGSAVAFMNSALHYNPVLLQNAFDAINKGISIHPKRLDMRFGKIFMLGETENYPEFANEIVTTIDYGNTIKNEWLWKDGKLLEDPKEFFLESLQSYISTIYNTEDDGLLPLMRQISEAVIKYYPNHVESLSNIALTYLITGEYDKGLVYLLKAEQVNPGDIIILNNIAEAYKRKGDKENAKIYFEKIIKVGSSEEADDARQKLKNLNR